MVFGSGKEHLALPSGSSCRNRVDDLGIQGKFSVFRVEGREGLVTEISTVPGGRTWVGNGSVLAASLHTHWVITTMPTEHHCHINDLPAPEHHRTKNRI